MKTLFSIYYSYKRRATRNNDNDDVNNDNVNNDDVNNDDREREGQKKAEPQIQRKKMKIR